MTAVPLPARAATARIAILNSDNPEPLGSLLRKSLRGLGYREGETLEIEFRLANGDAAALPGLAAELVRLKVDLMVAYLTPAAVVAKQATRDIPIIMMGAGDPVGSGLVASLARPAGTSPAPRRPPLRPALRSLECCATSYRRSSERPC